MQFIIRYAEIALKGKNRKFFTNQLKKNIAQKLPSSTISRPHSQLILKTSSYSQEEINQALSSTFGIAWFAPIKVLETQKLFESKSQILKTIKSTKNFSSAKTFAISATRIDKSLPFTSRDTEVQLGDLVRTKLNLKVNLDNPDITLYTDIHSKKTHIYTQKHPGPGGLPVKTSGKILLLLSGGFDSAAAAYLLAKRGAQIDYLHFHVFPKNQQIKNTKITQITQKLYPYTLSKNLHITPYHPFQLATLDLDKSSKKHELLVFRRLMLKTATLLAKKNNYQALATGDSLGQVASQTLSNITHAGTATDLTIFRPLIGHDKQEIISLIRKIKLQDQINQPYKDCCSIVSKNPATIAHPEQINSIEKKINSDRIAQKILEKITTIKTS